MVAGPAIGGLLFDLGGLMLPFLFVGLLILLFIASACFIMPSDGEFYPDALSVITSPFTCVVSSDAGIPSSQSSLKTIRLLFYDIRIIMVMVCVFVNIFAIGYIDVTLTNDLLQVSAKSVYTQDNKIMKLQFHSSIYHRKPWEASSLLLHRSRFS